MGAKGALMCPPTYYDIPARENPHMEPGTSLDRALLWREWTDLFNLLQKFGLSMRLMAPEPNKWDMVFAANGGWAHGNRALVANFKQPIRRPEKPHFWEALKRLGFRDDTGNLRAIPAEPEYIAWEGQGDTLMGSHGHCFLGYGFRSDRTAGPYVKDLLKANESLFSLELVSPFFYHLDTCFTALRPRKAIIYYPEAFSDASCETITGMRERIIELSPYLANLFVANSIYLNDVFLLNLPIPASLESRLLSARGEFLRDTNDDPRYRELSVFDAGEWQANVRLTDKMNSQNVRAPFQTKTQEGLRGLSWFVRMLWDLDMKVIPVYTSQFEPSGAGARCCVLFLDWLAPAAKAEILPP